MEPWIIEQIRQEEEQREQREQPSIQLPMPGEEIPRQKEKNSVESNRGVFIIKLWEDDDEQDEEE